MKICPCDWFNKQADWPIGEQNKDRQESQTQNAGKKGKVRSHQPGTEGEGDECTMLKKVLPMWQSKNKECGLT